MNKATAIYKENTINLAIHHKKLCKRKNCNVSLLLLLQMAIKLGIKFTKEEMKEFA